MTRIIAGTVGGRRIRAPAGGATRPTSERAREALFSRLEHLGVLDGARVLDLYAGSGALGLEAVSRGARGALLVEAARTAAQVASRNVRELDLPGVEVRAESVEQVLGRGRAGAPVDLVVADPPYALGERALAEVLRLLVARHWLAEDALLVIERSARSAEPVWPAGIRPLAPRRYGETILWFAEHVPGRPRDASASILVHAAGMAEITIPRPIKGDVVDVILEDHRFFESLLRELRDATSDRESARAALSAVLIAHGEAEETEVYPKLVRKDAIGDEEAEHGEHEHAEGNKALLELLECRGTDTQKFDSAVEKLQEALTHHVGEEETTILNPARTDVSDTVRATLGKEFLRVRSEHLDQDCGSPENVRRIVEREREQGKLDGSGEQ